MAERTGRPLTLLHVTGAGEPAESAMTVEELFDRHLVGLPEQWGDTEVRMVSLPGDAIAQIEGCAREAFLLVIGHRSLRNLRGTQGRGIEIARLVDIPLVSVPEDWDPERGVGKDIVVGISCATGGADAIGFAFQCASTIEEPLRAVHAWELDGRVRPPATLEDLSRGEQEEPLAVSEALSGWREKYPDVTVTTCTHRGPVVDVLLDASRDAQLMVLGGHAPVLPECEDSDTILRAVLRHAHCPVAVVHVRHASAY